MSDLAFLAQSPISAHIPALVAGSVYALPKGHDTQLMAQAAIEECEGPPSAFVYMSRAMVLVTLGWDAETVANGLHEALSDHGYLAG